MTDTPLIVKKYGNRRLYDTEASRYITLEELGQMLKMGRDVKVVDAKSGTDLTKMVLLQIIAEEEKERDLLPLAFLKQLVQLGDASMREALQRYLSLGLDAFLDAQKQVEQRYRDFAGTFFNPMMWMAPFAGQNGPVSQESGSGSAGPSHGNGSPGPFQPPATPQQEPPVGPEVGPATPASAQAGDGSADDGPDGNGQELEELRAQLAQMQKMLSKLSK